MDNEKLDPKQSKCFTCQFGLCMMQENTAFLEANFPMMGGPPPNPFEAPPSEHELDWADNESDEDEDDNEPKKIMESRVCSLCYWAPPGVKIESPIVTSAVVKECSRYNKRDE